MLAILRPDSWNLPLFLHVLGAIALFGGTLTVVVLGFAARRNAAGHALLLARLSFRTLLFLVLPAWILMRAGAQWIVGKEFPGKTPSPDWVNVGFAVSEPGLVVLVALGVVAFLSARRGGSGRLASAVPALASIYLVALAVAWWAMSAKPGA